MCSVSWFQYQNNYLWLKEPISFALLVGLQGMTVSYEEKNLVLELHR